MSSSIAQTLFQSFLSSSSRNEQQLGALVVKKFDMLNRRKPQTVTLPTFLASLTEYILHDPVGIIRSLTRRQTDLLSACGRCQRILDLKDER